MKVWWLCGLRVELHDGTHVPSFVRHVYLSQNVVAPVEHARCRRAALSPRGDACNSFCFMMGRS